MNLGKLEWIKYFKNSNKIEKEDKLGIKTKYINLLNNK